MRVAIREVGPRDGFQNEPEVIATDDKVRLIELLAAAGLKRLEVTSFVRADVIPQLADGAEVLRRIAVPDDVSLSVLIPNERGLENALPLRDRFHEVNVFLSASESHNRANVNRSIEESLSGPSAWWPARVPRACAARPWCRSPSAAPTRGTCRRSGCSGSPPG
jgi:hydroxymethylglutaryl-CoA lyase